MRELRAWVASHTPVALTLIGLAFYGGALIAYAQFYDAFGLQPHEVGLDYTTTLTQTLSAFAYWLLTLVSYFLLVLLWVSLGVWGLRIVRSARDGWRLRASRAADGDAEPAAGSDGNPDAGAPRPPLTSSRSTWSRLMRPAIVLGLAVVLSVAFLGLAFGSPNELADRVKAGHEVRPATLDTPGMLIDMYKNPLRIRVQWARVASAQVSEAMPAGLVPTATYAYLGRSQDTIILYDNRSRRILRVPASLIVVSNGTGD